MKIFKLLMIVNLGWTSIFSQSLELEIPSVKTSIDSIFFDLKIKNINDKSIILYLPDEEDLCRSIVRIYFIDANSNEELRFYSSCEYFTDLDTILLNWKTSIVLHGYTSCTFKLAFPKANFTSFFSSKKNIILKIDLDYNFYSRFEKNKPDAIPIFKEILTTSRFF